MLHSFLASFFILFFLLSNYTLAMELRQSREEIDCFIDGENITEEKDLYYLYKKLHDLFEEENVISCVSIAIARHIDKNFHKNKDLLLDEKYSDIFADNSKEVLLKVIYTKNLPRQTFFLIPLFEAVKQRTDLTLEDYLKIFRKISSFKSYDLIYYVDYFLEKINELKIDFTYGELIKLSHSIIGHTSFLREVKKRQFICFSDHFRELFLYLLHEFYHRKTIGDKYEFLRLIEVYDKTEKLDKWPINAVVTYLVEVLLENNAKTIEEKIFLFDSFFYLDLLDINIDDYYYKISEINIDIAASFSSHKNMPKKIKNIWTHALVLFKSWDDKNHNLGTILARINYTNNPDKHVSAIYKFICINLSEEKRKAFDAELKQIIKNLSNSLNDLSVYSIDKLLEICKLMSSPNYISYSIYSKKIEKFIRKSDENINSIKRNKLVEELTIKNVDLTTIREAFNKNIILSAFSLKKKIDLSQFCYVLLYELNDIIFKEGNSDEGNAYFLLEGDVNIVINDVVVKTVHEGELFGEFLLFSPGDRCASAVVINGPAKIIVIDATKFKDMAKKRPGLLLPFIAHFRDFVLKGNLLRYDENYLLEPAKYSILPLRSKELIEQMSINENEDYQIKILNQLLHYKKNRISRKKYTQGIICSFGEECENIIFILQGSIAATMGGDPLKEYYQGDILGITNLFQKNPTRTAYLITNEAEVLEIPRKVFESYAKNYPYLEQVIQDLISMIKNNNDYNFGSTHNNNIVDGDSDDSQ